LAGEKRYFVSSLPDSVCQKKENRKIDEIGDVQGFSWHMAFALLEDITDGFTKKTVSQNPNSY
jgi:hypothetical protein